MKIQIYIVALICMSLFMHVAVSQTPINVKYGDDVYRGSGAADGNSYWNNFSLPSGSVMTNILDANGVKTSVDIGTIYKAPFGGFSAVGSSPANLLSSGVYGSTYFAFYGLLPNVKYDIYIYVYNKSNEATTVTIDNSAGGTRTPTHVDDLSKFKMDHNYVVFYSVVPNAKNYISGSVKGDWTGLNGLQIVAINPPATVSSSVASYQLKIHALKRKLQRARQLTDNAVRAATIRKIKKQIGIFEKLINAG